MSVKIFGVKIAQCQFDVEGGRDEGGGVDGRVPAVLHVPLGPHHGSPGHLRGRGGGGRLGQELPGGATGAVQPDS